jgi:hypothetical protein
MLIEITLCVYKLHPVCRNHARGVEITLMRVEITLVRVKIAPMLI